ncbi:MAG: ATP-binding protein, partial [Bacteroidales bacterium]|nr:ATP-binding protein [Bacteroidales bacterium]
MQNRFQIDARLILQLGRDSIKDYTTALIELVKNSYDADATKVEIEIYCNKEPKKIRIADNGFGMTENEIDKNWLVIGYSEKRKLKRSEKNRRKTGEKGIGRIATDRLGRKTKLISKSKYDKVVGLEVNWDEFDVENKRVKDIKIKQIKNPKITFPISNEKYETGTEIIITELRQDWTKEDIGKLYQELSYLTPLFTKIEDFDIILINDIDQSYPKYVKSAIYSVSEIELTAVYDGGDEILYTIKNRYAEKEDTEVIKLNQLYQNFNAEQENQPLRCGPFDLNLSFYLRQASVVKGTDFTLKDLRNFLDTNAGVKIYRDNIAVKPYGFQKSQFGEDWLNLAERKAKDPAGIGRKTYKITPNQLVGAVNVSRDHNQQLIDSAAREGLVENEAFNDLKLAILGSINLL